MDLIERSIQVTWRHRVLFTDHVFDSANPILVSTLATSLSGGPGKTLVVLDAALEGAQQGLSESICAYFSAHSEKARLVRPPLIIPGGEQAKNSWASVSELHKSIEHWHIDRHSFLIAVGGGAMLDVAGLAAATAHRGIRLVRIPTTTLSQCDSGVGVKNGVNAFGKKNFIGTFAPPLAVINDFHLTATLAPRDKRAGFAEAVKAACIRDQAFFQALEQDAERLRGFDSNAMRRLIRRCAEAHINHIVDGGDPFESGSARPLDFGHWAAHKLEQLSEFGLRHGEAVAIGIGLDVIYSRRMGFLEPAAAERILELLEKLGFSLFAPELLLEGTRCEFKVLEGLEEFREHLGGRLAITLLRDIGTGFEVHDMNQACVVESIKELRERHLRLAGTPQLIGV